MTSEAPKKPWERTREDKSHDIVQNLERKLESLEYNRSAILEVQDLSKGMFAEARAHDSKERATITNAVVELIDQCVRIRRSGNPSEEVKRMAEVLIQREADQEWTSDGINEDVRIFLFNRYFDLMGEGVPYNESSLKVLQKIKDHRFDDLFYDDVVSKVEEIKKDVEWLFKSTIGKEGPPLTGAAVLSESLGEEPVITTQGPRASLDQRLIDIDRKIATVRERIKRFSAQK